MTGDLHIFVSDLLHRRGIDDRDGFALRSAKALSTLGVWEDQAIRATISKVKTDVYRRNPSFTKNAVLDLISSRLAQQWRSNPVIAVMEQEQSVVNVLFITANPVNTVAFHPVNNKPLTYKPLDLDREFREIRKKIRASDHRDKLQLESCVAAQPGDLVQAFNEGRPQIVHFSGHGSEDHELILLDDKRNANPVEKSVIESLFKVMKDDIRVVVLNACFSKGQAAAITKHIDCAIGMTKAIGDEAAIIFGAAFYGAIGFGRSVQEAFDQAVLELKLAGIKEDKTPRLLTRKGINAANVKLLG